MPTATKHTYKHGTFVASGVQLEVHECGECGVMFAMALGFVRARRADHATWYCPNGHAWCFGAESEEERLRRERDEARDRAARERSLRDQTEATLRATKGVVTKQRKHLARVKAGICPCCNRSFQNLARHMTTKHPDYLSPLTPATPRDVQRAVTKG